MLEVRMVVLHPEAQVPNYANQGDAGADLYAVSTVVLAPGHRALVPIGICLELPAGTVGLIHPRSGLALHHGVTVLNAPGTIDSGYRGELMVLLINHGQTEFVVQPGMRVAQLVLQNVLHGRFAQTPGELATSVRGAGGYGSTGLGEAPIVVV